MTICILPFPMIRVCERLASDKYQPLRSAVFFIALPTIALKGDGDKITITLRAYKSDKYYCRNSWKSDNYMGSNTEKKP